MAHTNADKETIAVLQYRFLAGYQGPIITPSGYNHPSDTQYPCDIKKYIDTEVREGAMLGPFSQTPFSPWCQTNPLLTRPPKGLFWPQVHYELLVASSPQLSVINFVAPPKGSQQKMYLHSNEDLCVLIRKAGRWHFIFFTDVRRAYCQLPLDPGDWPLVCFNFEDSFHVDRSLSLALCGPPPTVKMWQALSPWTLPDSDWPF